jgi:hypothetical protein
LARAARVRRSSRRPAYSGAACRRSSSEARCQKLYASTYSSIGCNLATLIWLLLSSLITHSVVLGLTQGEICMFQMKY